MNILHLAETPLSGAAFRLMKVQQECGENSRLISHRNKYSEWSRVVFEGDINISAGYDKDEVFKLFREADVLHFHNYLKDQFILRLHPELKRHLKTKTVVFQVHSPPDSLKNLRSDLKDPCVDIKAVLAQYHARFFPEAEVVPNAVPIWDELHIPIPRNNNKTLISYSPSNKNLKGWNDKGYIPTTQAFRALTSICDSETIMNKPHRECLKMRQRSDITIDEVMTGSYHMCSLEAMSQGVVPVCNIDPKCEDALSKFTRTTKHPMVKANSETLISVLTELINDRSRLVQRQSECRRFMEQYWNPERITQRFRELYNK
ncbi:MAG: hypothetical protein DRI46_10785 [Chloroflexi bacterium]|nr:MAG: hypothetical protein DRI46_10785 [Chloroflexota bacterium]